VVGTYLMKGAAMGALGSLVVSLSLNHSLYKQGLDKADQDTLRFAKNVQDSVDKVRRASISFVGGVVSGALAAVATYQTVEAAITGVMNAINRLDEISKASSRLGIDPQELQELAYAGELADVSLESLGTSAKKLSQNMHEAASGSKEQAALFKALGVEVKHTDGTLRSTSDVMADVADVFAGMEDGATKTALAVKVFGKSGADMIPMMNGGSQAIREAREEAQRFGQVLGTDALKNAEAFNDNITRLGKIVDGVFNQIGATVLPTLVSVTEHMVGAAAAASNLGDQSAKLAQQQALLDWLEAAAIGGTRFAEVLVALGKTAYAVGGSLQAAGADVLTLATIFTAGPSAQIEYMRKGTGELANAFFAREEMMKEANRRWSDLWNYNGTAASDAIRAAFAKQRAAIANGGQAVDREIARFDSQAAAARAASAKLAESRINALLAASSGTKQVDEATRANEQWIDTLKRLDIELTEQERGLGKVSQAEKLLAQLREGSIKGVKELTEKNRQLRIGEAERLVGRQKQLEVEQLIRDAEIAAAKHVTTLAAADEAKNETLRSNAVTLQEQIDKLSMGEDAYDRMTAATMRATAADLEWQAQNEGGNAALEERARLLRLNADRMDELRQKRATKEATAEAARAAAEQAKAASDEWNRMFDQLGQSLTDALMEGGKSAGEQLKNYFRTVVLRPLIQGVMQPIAGAVMGALGYQQPGGAAAGMQQYAQLAQSLQSIYNYGAKAYNYLAAGNAAVGVGVNGLGGVSGSQVYTSAATLEGITVSPGAAAATNGAAASGGAGATAMSVLGWAAFAYAAAQYGKKLYSEGFTGSPQLQGTDWYDHTFERYKTDSLKGLGISDKWAEILGGSVRLNHMFGRAEPRIQGTGVLGTFSGGGFTGESYADILEKGGLFKDDKRYTIAAELDETIRMFFADAASKVVEQAKQYGEALGLAPDLMAGITKDAKVLLTGDLEKDKAEIAKALGEYGSALLEVYADAVKPLQQYGETVAQTIERVGNALLGANEALSQIGVGPFAKSVAGGQGAVDLTEMFGGTQGLQQAAGSFYDAFFTEAEKVSMLTSRLGEAFGDLGITMPDLTGGAEAARAAYVDLVQAQDVNTEAGRENLAALLGLSGAFNTLAQAADAAAQREAERAGTRQGLEIELLRATGQETAAVARERELELAALRKLDPALADLQDQIYRATDAAERQSARQGLEIELARALGNESFAVTLERIAELDALAKLDPALVGLKQQIYELTDAALEADKIRQVMTGLRSVVGDFLKGQDLIDFQAASIADALGGAGFGDVPIARILGSTRQELMALFQSLDIDGKQALLDIYPLFAELWDTMREQAISDLIDGIASSTDDLLAAYYEINPVADTMVESWRKNKTAMEELQEALDDIAGTKAVSAIDKLRSDVAARDALRGVIADNRDAAFDLLVGQGGQKAIDALKRREAELTTQFSASGSAEDAAELTRTVLRRIQLEGSEREKVLKAQADDRYKAELEVFNLQKAQHDAQRAAAEESIDASKRMLELSKAIPEFLGGLRAGSLSNLSFTDRLSQQRSLFERSLETGNDPQGALTAYLQQAQQLYGGATKQYSDIFTAALAQYEASITSAAEQAPRDIALAEAQLATLDAMAPKLEEVMVDVSGQQIEALGNLELLFKSKENSMTKAIDEQTLVLQAQLTELKTQIGNQERQITQAGEAYTNLISGTQGVIAAIRMQREDTDLVEVLST
jgi:hypothetical protein